MVFDSQVLVIRIAFSSAGNDSCDLWMPATMLKKVIWEQVKHWCGSALNKNRLLVLQAWSEYPTQKASPSYAYWSREYPLISHVQTWANGDLETCI